MMATRAHDATSTEPAAVSAVVSALPAVVLDGADHRSGHSRHLPARTATLADALDAEDTAEDTGWLDPADRMTCATHRRWIHECAHSDLHVHVTTGHRWCRGCRRQLSIAVDELAGTVTVRCAGCGRGPRTRADHRLIAACQASLTARAAARWRGRAAPAAA